VTQRSTTIRRSLIRSLLILVALTGGAIFTVTTVGASAMVEDLSVSLIERTAEHTNTELRRFVAPVERAVSVARAWGDSGLLREADTKTLNRLLIPLLEATPQISSAMVANSEGLERLILKQDDGTWVTRVVRIDAWDDMSVWTTWKSATELDQQRYELVASYDPRKTEWYKGAVELRKTTDQGVFWTSPYPLFTTKQPGLSAAAALAPDAEGRTWVIAFDVRVADVSGFTTLLAPTQRGKALVFTDDGRLVGLPRDDAFNAPSSQEEAILKPVADVAVPEVKQAYASFQRMERKPDDYERTILGFEVADTRWWAGFEPFDIGRGLRLWIAVVVPEEDFLGEVRQQQLWIIGISAAALLAALLLVLWLARSFSKPLEQLARQSARVRDLDLRPQDPVRSRLREVRSLSETQRQMLAALQSFSRYVPVDVVKELVARGEVARIGGRTAELTILFTDIRGFTAVAETMEPEALAAHMAQYFEALLEVCSEYGATVDKFVGDAIVAFWGAPAPNENHARDAARCAEALAQRVEALNSDWDKEGKPPLPTAFGLHSGSVVVGNIGAPERLAYTVLGDAVNVASRIEGLNRKYDTTILASEAVKTAYPEGQWRHVDRVAVRGRREPLDIYELGTRGADGAATA